MSVWSRVSHFKVNEFNRPEKMSEDLIERLDNARHLAGVPFYITSDYRDEDPRAHGDGDAVDFADNLSGRPISSRWRHLALAALYRAGFSRIGIYDKHLHADVSTRFPQDVTWTGKSR